MPDLQPTITKPDRLLGLCLLAMVLVGCSSTHSPAPIRERAPLAREKPTLPPVAAGFYRIQPGDTLYKIAFEQGQDILDLAAWNQIADPARILSGDILRVRPPAVTARALANSPAVTSKVLAKPGSAPVTSRVAGNPPTSEANVDSINDDAPPDRWSWPLHGPILARFGEGLNKGIDIGGQHGKLVQAAANGRVVYAGSGLRGYGKLIIIRHGKTLLSAYAHNARILVAEGVQVSRGQAVGEVGDSDADRVKLHFEIRELGKPVDPMNFLPNAG